MVLQWLFCHLKSDSIPLRLNLFGLMDFPIPIDTISIDVSILYFKGSQVKISRF